MAKKDKKGKKAKKASGGAAKLPKQIAGVKVPKDLRAPAGKLVEALKNPLVMDLAAAAMIAAATGLREGRSKGAGASGLGAARPTSSDLGAIIATKAVEGVRKLAANAANGGKADGGGAGGRPKN